MAEDANDVQAPGEISPEDFDGEQVTPKADPTPAKDDAAKTDDTKPEVEADKAKADPAKDDESAKTDEEGDEGKSPDTDKPDEKPNKGADDRKTELNTEIRDLVAQRNSLRESVSKANSEAYQPATEKELIEDGMSATDAKVEAMRQGLEVRDYNEKVADAQLTIESEANQVLRDFDWANPDSDNFKEELSTEAAQLLQANLVIDPNTNQVIGSNISPYQLYKTLDRAAGISSVQGKLEGQKATETMMANADTASSAAPAKKAENPLDKLWENPL